MPSILNKLTKKYRHYPKSELFMFYREYIELLSVTGKTFTIILFQRVGTLIAASLALPPVGLLTLMVSPS